MTYEKPVESFWTKIEFYLVVNGGRELDTVDLIHVGLEVDEADLGLLEVSSAAGSFWGFLQLLVQVGKFL